MNIAEYGFPKHWRIQSASYFRINSTYENLLAFSQSAIQKFIVA